MMPFEVKEITAASILTKSKLNGADYDFSCNPYIGCRFGCVYCYASFMARMVGKKTEDWGNFVYAKMNAPELIAVETGKLPNFGEGKVIWFSSVCDPYQGIEKKYRLTQKCLSELVRIGYRGTVSVLTKSDSVVDDLEIFKAFPSVDIGLTITGYDDNISRYFEKYAPPVSARLSALKKLNDNHIRTYAFVGPLLPHFIDKPETLSRLFSAIRDTGVTELYIEYLNLSPYIKARLKKEMLSMDSRILDKFYTSQSKDYRAELDAVIYPLVKRYGFTLRTGSTLYHKEMT